MGYLYNKTNTKYDGVASGEQAINMSMTSKAVMSTPRLVMKNQVPFKRKSTTNSTGLKIRRKTKFRMTNPKGKNSKFTS